MSIEALLDKMSKEELFEYIEMLETLQFENDGLIESFDSEHESLNRAYKIAKHREYHIARAIRVDTKLAEFKKRMIDKYPLKSSSIEEENPFD